MNAQLIIDDQRESLKKDEYSNEYNESLIVE